MAQPIAPELFEDVRAQVHDLSGELIDVSHQIFDNPELAFEEHFAHDLLTEKLESHGVHVERHAYGLDTAFAADVGTTGPKIAVICEYDALPGVGHACGHNVIAAAGLGAGLIASRYVDRFGGQLRILGTPAEEGGGGKEYMIQNGALDGVDAAIMIHGADHNLTELTTLANQGITATYTGVASHAAADPQGGRNALDAAVLGYMNVAALRQHIDSRERVHGIFTAGGDQPNVVPKHAQTHWYVRSYDLAGLDALLPRVEACLRAGADAAGCEVQIDLVGPTYAELRTHADLLAKYERQAARIGRNFDRHDGVNPVRGSTDMGNISQHVPAIHPMIAVAPPGTAIHTAEFAEAARGAGGDQAVVDGATALALTILDCWIDPLTEPIEGVSESIHRASKESA